MTEAGAGSGLVAPTWVRWIPLAFAIICGCGALFTQDDTRHTQCLALAAVSALAWTTAVLLGPVRIRPKGAPRPDFIESLLLMLPGMLFTNIGRGVITDDHGPFLYRTAISSGCALIGLTVGVTALMTYRRRRRRAARSEP